MTDLLGLIPALDFFSAQDLLYWFIDNASYLLVFLLMAVESSFIPFPSEIVVPPAVWLALTGSDNMNVVGIVFVATAGALVGASVNYFLSLWLGRPIVYGFANSRVGHFFLVDREKVDRSEKYFREHGAISTFIGRLIPAVRQLISIPAGLSRMNFWKFLLFTGLGAGLWNCVLALIGYLLSGISREALFETVEKYNGYLTIGGILLLVACIGYMTFKALSRKKSNRQSAE